MKECATHHELIVIIDADNIHVGVNETTRDELPFVF